LNLRRSLAWMSLAQAAAFMLQFGASMVLARHLSPPEMGIYALAAGVVGMLALVQAFGLQNLVVREPVLGRELERCAFSVNALIALGLSLAIVGASFLGEAVLGDRAVRDVLLVLAPVPLFAAWEFLPMARTERAGGFRTMALVSMSAGALAAALTVVLALRGHRHMSIAWAQLAAAGCSALLYSVLAGQYLRLGLGFAGWRRVLHHGLQMMAVSGVTAAARRLSELLLGRLLGLAALGWYTRASSLNELLWNNLHLAAGRVVFVDFAQLHREGRSLRERYLRVTDIATGLLWPAFAGLAVLAGPLIRVVYGEPWVPAALPLALLAIASMVLVSITMTWELFVATGRLAAQTRIEFIRAGGGLLMFGLACTVSLEAAAAARVAEAVFAVVLYRPHLNRMTGTRARDFGRLYARNVLATLAAVGPCAAVMAWHGGSPSTPWAPLAAAIGAGLLAWGLCLVLQGHVLVDEARRAWRVLLRRRTPAALSEARR
jgi:O-antigen/teichoic acid export membrane protein